MIASREYVKDLITKVLKSVGFKKEFNKYSMDETIIGSWIDGKPIYRKVFKVGPGLSTKQIGTVDNIDSLVNAYCNTLNSAGTAWYSNPADSTNNNLGFTVEKSTGIVKMFVYGNWPSGISLVVIEYTKTTD